MPSNSNEEFKQFFRVFKTEYVPLMLPGIVGLSIEFFRNFKSTRQTSFVEFFEKLINFLGDEIKKRKIRIEETIEGTAANYGLYLSQAYQDDDDSMKVNARAHKCSFLMNHLYYLVNPVNLKNYAFVSFRPIQKKGRLNPLRVFKNGEYVEWASHYTFFKSGDVLISLACMAIRSSDPIALDLEDAEN